ncbi:hypothetical protein BC828DRAFT_387832 [Blastocladiella britannica]|nr:hypothetical protein BC828DRAFT_387832 [Blastocladiella britannica]
MLPSVMDHLLAPHRWSRLAAIPPTVMLEQSMAHAQALSPVIALILPACFSAMAIPKRFVNVTTRLLALTPYHLTSTRTPYSFWLKTSVDISFEFKMRSLYQANPQVLETAYTLPMHLGGAGGSVRPHSRARPSGGVGSGRSRRSSRRHLFHDPHGLDSQPPCQ